MKGSSLQAINKYISKRYKVDTEKNATLIRQTLLELVDSGKLEQPKRWRFELATNTVSPTATRDYPCKTATPRRVPSPAAVAGPSSRSPLIIQKSTWRSKSTWTFPHQSEPTKGKLQNYWKNY